MPKKVVHIVYSGFGGTTDYIFNLIQGDIKNQYHHYILFYGVESVPDESLEFAETICDNVLSIKKESGMDRQALNMLGLYLEEIDPDAVTLHVNSLILNINPLLPKKTKLIFVEHQANHLKSRKELLWSAMAQRRADVVVCLTEEYKEILNKKIRFLFKKKKNRIIETGLILSDYEVKRDYSRIKKIGMIGRVNEFRDHRTLIETFIELDPSGVELHIAGDGPMLYELRRVYDHERVIYHGRLSKDEIDDLLKELDIYVHSSFGETSSMAIMQAQASGLPIIATRVPGISNYLADEDALLFELEDAEELKKYLSGIIESPELRKRYGEASMSMAEKRLSHVRMFNEYLMLFE